MKKITQKNMIRQLPVYGAAAALVACSAFFNASFGYTLGTTDASRLVWQAASVGSDILKAAGPVALVWAIANRDILRGFASILLIAVTASYSVAAAIGFAASSRADMSSGNTDQQQAYDRSTAAHKSSAAEIARIVDNPRWKSTSGCSDATVRKSREFCKINEPLYRSALAKISASESIMAKGRPAQADPQAAAIAAAMGLSILQVQTGLSWLAAGLVELGSLFGFLIASGARSKPRPVAKPVKTTSLAPATLPRPTGSKMTRNEALDFIGERGEFAGTLNQIADSFGVSRTSVSSWLKSWEQDQLIALEQDGQTRRLVVLA